jgi:hypothetical protein
LFSQFNVSSALVPSKLLVLHSFTLIIRHWWIARKQRIEIRHQLRHRVLQKKFWRWRWLDFSLLRFVRALVGFCRSADVSVTSPSPLF